MKRALFISILTLCSSAIYAQINGQVSFTALGRAQSAVSSQPAAGVVVSNGYHCVKTDAQGRFTLPDNAAARFVFITKPANFRLQGRHYIKIEPKAVYDFKIESLPIINGANAKGGATVENGEKLSFVQITDVESFTKKGWIDNLQQWVAANPTAFIINTGDICYEKGIKMNGTQLRAEHFGTDMFYCIGNHDLVKGEYGEQMFEQYFGPAYYSFDAGNIHFMVLPMLGGDHAPSYTRSQLVDWMRQDLAHKEPSKKVVMFNHDLWFTGDNLKFGAAGDTIDMASHNLIAFCYGHWHSHYAVTVAGIKTYSSSTPDKGGIDHGASVFRVLDIDRKGGITSRSRYTHIEGAIASVVPAAGDCLKAGINKIAVNAYRTAAPTAQVSVEIDGRKTNLTQSSDWNWVGEMKLPQGKYNMKISAQFADGTTLVKNTPFTVAENPTVEWNNVAAANIWMVKPIVSGNKIFTATIDDDNNADCRVAAFDLASGRELWRAKTDNSIKNSISVTENRVVACDSDGKLYCFDAASGSLIWKTKLPSKLLPHTLQGITIDQNTVYAGQGDGFCAVDIASGKILWANKAWSGGEGTTSTIATHKDVVVASGHWNGIFAHNKATGGLLWKSQDPNTRFRDGSPAFCGDTLFLATTNRIIKMDLTTGRVLASKICDVDFSVAAAPLLTPNVIYCSTSDKGIAAFNRHTLDKIWGYNSSPAMFYSVPYAQDFQCSVESSPVLYNGLIIFAGTDGVLYGVNADGTTAFKRCFGSPIFSTPAIHGNSLIVTDFAGNIVKINLANFPINR